ncbi:MAG TPA: VOC family protein [Micromonosporaceae bacterium]|nr:VOC family protein [Micromonosporaceae bacterium]
MALTVDLVTIDCADPRTLSGFWAKALGYTVEFDQDGSYVMLGPAGPGEAGNGEGGAAGGAGVRIGLQQVAEPKVGKNRVHLDLRATDRVAEVERLVGLGATAVDEHAVPHFAWTVLADPAGNLFCVGSES